MVSFKEYKSFLNLPNSVDQLIGDNYFWNLNLLKDLESSKSIGGDTGWEIKSICMFDNEELVGFIPMFIKHHSYGEYVFDWSWAEAHQRLGLSYFPKLFIGIPFSPVNANKLIVKNMEYKDFAIEYIEKLMVNENLSSIHYVFSSHDDEINHLFKNRGWANRKTIQYVWDNESYSNFDDFLKILRSEKRKKIKQDRKKVASERISFKTITGKDINENLISFFYKCYSMTYYQHGSPPYIDKSFFESYFINNSERVVIFVAYKDQLPVACSFSLKANNILYGRYWGALQFIPSLHFELSYYQGIQYCIDNKLDRFYAGIQGEHKLSRGFNPEFSDSFHFVKHPQFKEAIHDFVEREADLNELYKKELEQRSSIKY